MAADGKIPLPVDYVLLKVLEEKAGSDPKQYAVLAAFEGLAIIAGCWRGHGSFKGPVPSDKSMLPVPRWIIDTVGAGWLQHRTKAPTGQTLGRTLKIEGGGQGRRPAKDEWNLWLRDLRIASEFLHLRQTKSYGDTVATVAEQSGFTLPPRTLS